MRSYVKINFRKNILSALLLFVLLALQFGGGTLTLARAKGTPTNGATQTGLMPAPNSCSSSAPGDPIPGAVSVGQLSDGSVNFLVTFSNRNAGQLQSLINSGKIISEEQFEANYAPTQTDYDQVASFLTENNITVTQTWANRLLLAGSGEASDVERAFNAEIDLFQHNNVTFYSNLAEAKIPTLTELGVASVEISNFTEQPAIKTSSPAVQPYQQQLLFNPTPTELMEAYGTYSAISKGKTGAGETIGIVDAYGDPTLTSDISSFNSYYSLPNLNLTIIGSVGRNSAWAGETALDVEWAHAMAPNAAIILQLSPDNSGNNLMEAVETLLNSSTPPNVVSLSWGAAESSVNPSSYTSIFEYAASRGIQVYAASGDNGAYNGGNSLSVNYPASDPNVIAVGGTDLYTTAVAGIYNETGWSNSGGGYSTVFTEPTYQSGAKITDPTSMRAIPDVSLDADPDSGVYVVQGGKSNTFGGTSLSTDLMAAIATVALSENVRLNSVNLYGVYSSSSEYSETFHDILSGNNGYYSCGLGWSAVTGLGSINFQGFVTLSSTEYALNLRTLDWSGNILPFCIVTVNGSGELSGQNGWANFTLPSGTYFVTVNWQGTVVNQTSIQVKASNLTVDVKCHVWSLTVNAEDNDGALLQPNNMQIYVTFPNGTHVNPNNVNTETWLVQNGTYYFAVKWQGNWVGQNQSVALDTTTATQNLVCNVYSLSFTFKDSTRALLYTNPVLIQMQAPNGTLLTLNKYSIPQAQNGSYTITKIIWNDVDVVPSPNPSISLTSDSNFTINCLVYNLKVKVTDLYGLPVSGVRVTAVLSNGTAVAAQSGSGGISVFTQVPQGTFTGSVSYLLQTSSISGNAAQASTTPVSAKIYISLNVILSIIIVIVCIVAFVFWRRRRKAQIPPEAPTQPSTFLEAGKESQPPAPAIILTLKTGRFCGNCGVQLQEGVKFCGNCGAPVISLYPTTSQQVTPSASSPIPVPSALTKAFCVYCGSEIEPKFKFCPYCGAKQP